MMVTSRPSPGGTMRGPSEAGESEPMAEMLQRRPGPQGHRDRGPKRRGRATPIRRARPRLAPSSPPMVLASRPSPHRTDCCRSIRRSEGVKDRFACTLTRHFHLSRCPAETSVLDAAAEAYHNPAAVWWGHLHLPRSCRRGPRSRHDLLVRSSMSGHPDPFRSVRDLGRVPARCWCPSGIPEGRSPRWLPAWLPAACLGSQLMVFKSIRGSSFDTATTWAFSMSTLCVVQDHPAYIP